MQHTLLPLNERKALRREYRVRAAVVLLFTLSVAVIVGVASLFPSFLAAISERNRAENSLADIKKAKDLSGLTAIQQKVASGLSLLNVLDESNAQPKLSALISNIIGDRGAVRIDTINIGYTGTTTAHATVRGFAPTRDELLAFKSKLETNQGTKVSLPVSELAKGADIAYSIDITLTLP